LEGGFGGQSLAEELSGGGLHGVRFIGLLRWGQVEIRMTKSE
jgi:hypothetical protein